MRNYFVSLENSGDFDRIPKSNNEILNAQRVLWKCFSLLTTQNYIVSRFYVEKFQQSLQ
jgi:hypothetical protein